jgi:hypothetical protein
MAIFLSAAVMIVWLAISLTNEGSAISAFTPSDPPNNPIGTGKGIHPGRVVWVHEPDVTLWDGLQGDWWYDENTDADLADFMVVEAIRCLTGQQDEVAAWDALFRHFNQVHGNGDVGYSEGEKIAIKLNMNQDNTTIWKPHRHMPSPQVICALLDQLINVAGVSGEMITLYDASRYIGDPIYNKIKDNPDPNFHRIKFVVRPDRAGNGRQNALHDPVNLVYFATPNIPGGIQAYLPQCVSEAKYLINMALLRPHQGFGVTLCGKNHFGTVYFPKGEGWSPKSLHDYGYRNSPMGRYNCLVDLIGHKHLGDKTLIYLIDGLYAGRTEGSEVIRFESFGDDWCSSLFASQDPVAIDSVALDFLRNEPQATECRGMGVDNYLHEAALAHNPPSGTIYDPDGNGVHLESLGVHEHWNNEVDRQYSRNLGIADGIELTRPKITDPNGPVENWVTGTRYTHIRHAVNDANSGDEIVVSAGTYRESFAFQGKNLILRSTDPNDSEIVAATIIDGGERAVTFSGGEDESCLLAGFTITDANCGVYCRSAGPTIANCRILGNASSGIKLWEGSCLAIFNSIVAGNGGAGIEMWADAGEQFILSNYAIITNCTVVGNTEHGIYGGLPAVTNCIVRDNGVDDTFEQIDCSAPTVNYSNVEGSFPGNGNIDLDPGFVVPGCWVLVNDIDQMWVHGDYHLRLDSPCIDAGDPDYASSGAVDIDGEPRVMAGRVDMGCDEVGDGQTDVAHDAYR